MKFIVQNVINITPQSYDIVSIKKHIERCGKVSYKSYNNTTDYSWDRFYEKLSKSKHGSVFEHGTVYLTIKVGSPLTDKSYIEKMDVIRFYLKNHYSRVYFVNEELAKTDPDDGTDSIVFNIDAYYITTNMRVIFENGRENDLDYLVKTPTKHYRRFTFSVITNIGVTREMNRHRVFSITEQSTRYCNYSKDKFDNEIKFILPTWLKDDGVNIEDVESIKNYSRAAKIYVESLEKAEKDYFELVNECGWQPQQARDVLPLSTVTEAVYTAFQEDWKVFIDMRFKGTTGAPHPEMKELASLVEKKFIES